MPVHSLEQIKKKEAGIVKTIAETGEAADPLKRRRLGKQLRRAQRRRRRMVVEQARRDKQAAKKAPAESPAESQSGAASEG